jgi:hypothetical protein
LSAAEDGVRHASTVLSRRKRKLREKVQIDRFAAVVHEESEDQKQRGHGDEGAHAAETQHDIVDPVPAGISRCDAA